MLKKFLSDHSEDLGMEYYNEVLGFMKGG